MQKINKKFCVGLMAVCVLVLAPLAFAESPGSAEEMLETEVGLDQMVEDKNAESAKVPGKGPAAASGMLTEEEQKEKLINESLKNSIEENKKLTQQNRSMEEELKSLRGGLQYSTTRIDFLNNQKDSLQRRVDLMEAQNKNYREQMQRLQATTADKEKELNQKLSEMEKQIAEKKAEEDKAMAEVLPYLKGGESAVKKEDLANAKKEAQENLKKLETHTQQMTTQVARIALENKKIKIDSAKLHYNLANTFFERGDYKRAAGEYKQVVELLPFDADAHYNLAFVYGEFLNQPSLALEYYKMYLHLNPYASDAPLVKEKILEAELSLRTAIPSPAEEMLNRESIKEDSNVMITTTK